MLSRSKLIIATVLIVIFLIGSLAGFLSRIQSIPYTEMQRMANSMQARAGINQMALSPPVSPDTMVPRNNPDTRPTFCWVSLSDGPVRVFGPLPDSYWSLSIYTPDSLNPFVISDRDLQPAGQFDFVIAQAGGPRKNLPETERLIELNANEAVVLLRYYVPTPNHVETIDALRREARCEPYSGI